MTPSALHSKVFTFLFLSTQHPINQTVSPRLISPLIKGEANPKTVHSNILGPDEECLLAVNHNLDNFSGFLRKDMRDNQDNFLGRLHAQPSQNTFIE